MKRGTAGGRSETIIRAHGRVLDRIIPNYLAKITTGELFRIIWQKLPQLNNARPTLLRDNGCLSKPEQLTTFLGR